MEKQKVWTDSYHVNCFDALPKSITHKARLTSLLSYFEESAWRHARNMGFGFYDAASNKNAWVLSMLRLEVFDYPKWGDNFKIKTWPLGTERLFAKRTANYLDGNDNIIASLTSLWLIIDIDSRRPQIPDKSPMLQGLQFSDEKNNIRWPVKLELSGEFKQVLTYKTRHCDLDINYHINNARYAEWVCNALHNKLDDNFEIKNFEINYLHETVLGDVITLFMCDEGNNSYKFLCKRNSDDKNIFIACVSFD